MVKKVIIAYSLQGVKKPLKITRKIYGYTEFSNYSKYKYERAGILSDIKYEKLFRACIMIDDKDADEIIEEFKKLEIKMKILYVDLRKMTEF
jgi:hypothetical protein